MLCGSWLLFNIIIALASLGAFWERHQIRHFHRAWARGNVDFALNETSERIKGELTDLSLSGVGFFSKEACEFAMHQELILYATDSYGNNYQLPIKVMRHIKVGKKYIFGCEFIEQNEHLKELVSFVYGDSKRWQDFWKRPNKHPSPLSILRFFIRIGISGAKQGFVGICMMISAQYKKSIQLFKKHRLVHSNASKK